MDTEYIAAGVIRFVTFLFSTTCHEAAHAFAAKWLGDSTAADSGQASLNPLPHLRREPFGMILVPLLCFATHTPMIGWASAPYDPFWARRYPRRSALMSLAGPGANFLLVLIAAALLNAGISFGVWRSDDAEGPRMFLGTLFDLNLLLGIFNLLPIPPLDGFSVLGLFLPEGAAVRLHEFGDSLRQFSFIGLFLGWQYLGERLDPVFAFAYAHLLRF